RFFESCLAETRRPGNSPSPGAVASRVSVPRLSRPCTPEAGSDSSPGCASGGMLRPKRWCLCLGMVALVAGCAAIREGLPRAEASSTAALYADALVWLASLEADGPHMDRAEKVRCYDLRGMTAYRLEHRDDALYFLSLATELAADDDAALRTEW